MVSADQPLVREIVIVISDLYLPPAADHEVAAGIALPGLEQVARFARRSALAGGWRPWLARSVAGEGIAALPPASIAATVLTNRVDGEGRGRATSPPWVWIATPVHLLASLTSLQMDRRGVLRLCARERATLALEFQRLFHDSGFALEPLDSGDFVLAGPQISPVRTFEPARWMGGSVAGSLPEGSGAAVLRKLSAEIEMWLHGHELNDARALRGAPAVTALWLWGGGPAPNSVVVSATRTDIAFGSDAYLSGLWNRIGRQTEPMPQELAGVFGYPDAQRVVLVLEVADMLHSNPRWTLLDAATHIDGRFIAPALRALQAGKIGRLEILANDRRLSLRPGDRLKLWRRASPGLSGLQ